MGFPAGFPFGYYLASERHGLVLCAIPKCGCTTTKYWFARMVEGQRVELPEGAIHAYCERRYALKHMEPDRAAALLERAVVFAIVREPLERLASAYAAKFVRSGPLQAASKPVVEAIQLGLPERIGHDTTMTGRRAGREEPMPACSKVDYERGVSFREFVGYLLATPDRKLNPHWRPQSDFILPERVGLIGPLEHLGWTVREAQRRAGIDGPAPRTRQPRAAREGPAECLADATAGELRERGLSPAAASLYDHELRERVRERFAADVELHARAARPDSAPLAG